MPNQAAAVQINSFVKGIITEASPLTFPDNASIDEVNMVLNKDGSRRRRLGMDYETGFGLINSGMPALDNISLSSFTWKQPGGYTDREFLVVQIGSRLTIFNSAQNPISWSGLYTTVLSVAPTSQMSMTSVDGLLIVADGSGNIYSFDYNGVSVIASSGRLLIRDLLGVADIVAGSDLLTGTGVGVRPPGGSDSHTYNLRNQTFAIPRYRQTGRPGGSADPIVEMVDASGGLFPANSDNVVTYLYSDANNDNDRNTKRYFVIDAIRNPLGTNRAPTGYFIIDAMDRGASRISEAAKLGIQYPQLVYTVNSLPADRTPGGASVVSSYAGRVWYAGFSAQLIGGDSQSPRMTSYVLFSRLVRSPSDIFKCYQDGDPTSAEIPDLVDTDGGFLRLDGAYNIQQMVNVGEALMVIAENGVWKITGGSGYGFNATNYLTTKITEHGCVSPGSVVLIDNTFMYWADDGIYHVAPNQYGDWEATNITSSTIQHYFDGIPYISKTRCQGAYDSYQRKVRWLYNGYIGAPGAPTELILDVNLAAFYPSSLAPLANSEFPKVFGIVRVPPFTNVTTDAQIITLNGDTVLGSSLDNIVSARPTIASQTSELYYLTMDSISGGNIVFTFSWYKDESFTDWVSKDGVGLDAKAYLVTGWSGGGDFQRQKQVPYLTVHSLKTETGFDVDYTPINPSSIIVQGQWAWTNRANAGKWTSKFQAYRHKRFWAPTSNLSGFDDGEYVVVTRNKLRGRGRVLSLLFETEPKKDFHLLGWSYIVTVNGSV